MSFKNIKKIVILTLLSFLVVSCSSKKEEVKKVEKKKVVKKVVKPKYRALTSFDYDGNSFTYEKISLKIPLLFTEKENKTFFMDNGINITFSHDQIEGKVEEYVKEVYTRLKKEYVKIIKDPETILINNKEATLMKYVLDRQKYFVEIYSVIIQDKKDIYIVNISGKKKDMVKNNALLMGIFNTIKLNK